MYVNTFAKELYRARVPLPNIEDLDHTFSVGPALRPLRTRRWKNISRSQSTTALTDSTREACHYRGEVFGQSMLFRSTEPANEGLQVCF